MARLLQKQNFNPKFSYRTELNDSYYRQSKNLIAWYSLLDSTDFGKDSSGNGYDGNVSDDTVQQSTLTPYQAGLYHRSANFNSGIISNTTLAPVIENLDKFCLSFWANISNFSVENGVLQIGSLTNGIQFYFDNLNQFIYVDYGWSGDPNSKTRSYGFSENTWYHIFVNVDRTTTSSVVSLYVNGVLQTWNAGTPPTGTKISLGTSTTIGKADIYSSYNLKLSDLTIWKDNFTQEQILSVYYSSSGVRQLKSGIISNPARILLQERDNHTGSYPTIARTGDPDFTGKYRSFYDDTNTVNFSAGNVVYPTSLPASSFWVSGGVSTPNILQGLLAAGTSSKGVADSQISFTPGENISPFVESRIYIDSDSEFFQTGTDKSVLPGFDERLSSKSIVRLSTNPAATTSVLFSTGTNQQTKPQTFVLRFVSATSSSYVPAGAANSHAITISVTGSSVSDDIPGSSTTGGTATSTYGFVFIAGANQGNISDLTSRQKVTIDITGASSQKAIAQAFVTGVNNLTNAPFFAEFITDAATYVFNQYGDVLDSITHPAGRNYVVIRNRNPGKPLLDTSSTTKVDYTTFNYTNGGPSCDGAEGFLSTVISGTVLCTGVDQTLHASSNHGISAGINSGIAYFNWDRKNWELVGDHRRGRNVDYANSEPHIVTASMLSIVPVAFTNSKIRTYDYSQLGNLTGLPSDAAGFPISAKFDATGSQAISMTGSLSSPFMVEKISLTFSASMGYGGFNDSATQAHNSTFFLMIQRDSPLNSTVDGNFENFNLFKSPRQINKSSNKQPQKKDRRIVWFGRVGKYNSRQMSLANLQTVSSSLYNSCDLWIGNDYSSVTGSFTINAPCRIVGQTPRATPNLFTREMNLINSFFGIESGGRNLQDISDGRSFVRGVLGSQLSGSITTLSSNEGSDYIKTYENVFTESPFVMLPDDKLILAFVNQPFPNNANEDSHHFNESQLIASHSFNLCPGAGNITLFGSLLQNNLPVSQKSNQPLTSNAIHEDLHYDNPVFDQFDVEPYATLTGSYVDLVITGSMLVTPIGDANAADVRKVQASVVAGQAGTTGSLQRFVSLISNRDSYYDSYPPNIGTILNSLGKGLQTDGAGGGSIVVATGSTGASNVFDEGWYFRSAYEISSVRFTSFRTSNIVANSYDFAGNLIDTNVSPVDPRAGWTDGSTESVLRFALLSAPGATYNQSFTNWQNLKYQEKMILMYKYLFGFGNDRIPNASRKQTGPGVRLLFAFDSIRGYKYGLNGVFGSYSNLKFRRDRYGQFRDMLEQSQNAAFLVENSVEYPVEVKFFSRPGKDGKGRQPVKDPTKTHTQNLSSFATSSLPYFDLTARERSDNPDITLTSVTLS